MGRGIKDEKEKRKKNILRFVFFLTTRATIGRERPAALSRLSEV